MTFPQIDPVIIHLGPLALRWYGLMYLLGFIAGYALIRHLSRLRDLPLNADLAADLIFYCAIGVVLGGRLGYVFFYNPAWYLQHPLEALELWKGGMSFHGGLLGVVVATLIFCRRQNLPVLAVGDVLVTAATVGLGLGRIGNFINAELWGRPTDLPWGMVFPGAGPEPRHPSQLYQAFLEGFVLLLLLYWLHRRKATTGVVFFTFFLAYGAFRFLVEFFRQPDAHLGYLWGGATMGQILCLPMILFGIGGLLWLRQQGRAA